MRNPLTLLDKLWLAHAIHASEDGTSLLFVDRHLLHEGLIGAFAELETAARPVRRPDLTFGVTDRYLPSRSRAPGGLENQSSHVIAAAADIGLRHGLDWIGPSDPRQGVVHVTATDQGLVLPGTTLVCADSATCAHGAFGTLAFGIAGADVAHVLATQTVWQRKPSCLRMTIAGAMPYGVTAKDLALCIIARLGAAGAAGQAVEFAGSAVLAMSMEQRQTLCGMAAAAGALIALIAPDETTIAYLRGRMRTPKGPLWDKACAAWRLLGSDRDARFARDIKMTLDDVQPTVTWGTSADTGIAVSDRIPDPSRVGDTVQSRHMAAQLADMDLRPNLPLEGLPIDQVFVGSCMNGRIEDLRAAAGVLRHRRVAVPCLVVPGSTPVRRQAEREGLHDIFLSAGASWGEAGCSACIALNGDVVLPGERCASTGYRNFVGRQGPGARTHLMSPLMAAAAAVTGRITDVRSLMA